MPGLYTHTSRPTGTVITQVIYDGDHQNHINNMIPSKMDDLSSNVSAMQTTFDQGDLGGEVLPTNLQEEIQSLRFLLSQIKETTYHYEVGLMGLLTGPAYGQHWLS